VVLLGLLLTVSLGFASESRARPAQAAAKHDGLIAYSVKTGIYAVSRTNGRPRLLVPWRARSCGKRCVVWNVPRDPRFSPDGRRLTYFMEPNRVRHGVGRVIVNERTVWVADADGSHRRRVDRGHNPAFSPDGRAVIYMTNPDAWPKHPIDVELPDPFSDEYGPMRETNLVTGKTRGLPAPGATNFTRDGRHMIFVHHEESEDANRQIITIEGLDGSQPHSLPAPRRFYSDPIRVVAGDRVSYDCVGPRGNQPDICLLDLQTGHVRRLVHTEKFWELFAVSSPSGRYFAIAGLHGLYVTDRNGRHARRLVSNGSGPNYVQSAVPYDPDWQP
jgi:Tol biopolymer transport system component